MQIYLAVAWLTNIYGMYSAIFLAVQSQRTVWLILLQTNYKAYFGSWSTVADERPLLSWVFREHVLHKEVSWKVTSKFMIPNITECELLEVYALSKSSAISLHQRQAEVGTLKDAGSPALSQLKQTPVHTDLCAPDFRDKHMLSFYWYQ